MRRVFVDSGGFVALLVPGDAAHARAKAIFERANNERLALVTTNAVVVEAYAVLLVRARHGRRSALALLDGIERSGVHIERVTRADEQVAVNLVRTHEDKTYSLCDAQSFAVMERLGIAEAIAFDSHFRAYGKFTIL